MARTNPTSRFLAKHRARTLVALGLPTGLFACGASPTTRQDGADGQTIGADGTARVGATEPGPPPIVDAGGGSLRCGPDQLREIACTSNKAAATCPSSLPARGEHYVGRVEDFASERPFTFDQVLSSDVSALEPALSKCCFVRCSNLTVGASAPMPVIAHPGSEGIRTACIAMPDAPSKFPATGAPKCAAALVLPGRAKLAPFQGFTKSFEDPERRPASWLAERCCYHELTSLMGVGRPYRIRGLRQLPKEPPVKPIGGSTDARVVRHWHAVARGEHASVFAFAALLRELEHWGAPVELTKRIRRAERDEATHARLAYGWLEQLTNERVVPAPLELAWAPRSLAELAKETLRDGCFEEALGAALADHLAAAAGPGELGKLLRRIACDEARHAELAWRILAFTLQRDPSVAETLSGELERIRSIACELQGAPDTSLEHAGVPATATMRALGRRVAREWVEPCLHALTFAQAA